MKLRKLFLTFSLILIIFSGCTHKSPLENENNNEANALIITSFTAEKSNNDDNPQEFTYKQKVTWQAPQEEDIYFAYRINTSDSELPEDIVTNDAGWILHEIDKKDTSIPLSSQKPNRTIWTTETSFEYAFHSQNGQLARIITDFELKSLHNDEESGTVSANFFKEREIGTVLGATTGDINGRITGTALTFTLREDVLDVFVEGLYADYFMFRLNTIAASDSSIIETGEWFNSNNWESIREVFLNSETTPALVPNDDDELTQFEAYVVTRSGYEDSENTSTLNFKVEEGFHPGSLIYITDTYLLGENHFIPYNEPALGHSVPYTNTEEGIHYSTPFFIDKDSTYAALNSDDLEIYLHYGWDGEYYQNNIYQYQKNSTYDEQTGENYYAEILYFDLRLDNNPLQLPQFPLIDYLHTDNDGTQWLRIPKDYENSQQITLSDLDSGLHTLVLRVVDTQLAVETNPTELSFKLQEPVPAAEKTDILILDDDLNHPTYCPDDMVDNLYLEMCDSYAGNVDVLDRRELIDELFPGYQGNPLHFGKDAFSPTDLDTYKLIIYHTDTPTFSSISYFFTEYDVMNLYLRNGGNIILSGGANISNLEQCIETDNFDIFEKYFGLALDEAIQSVFVPEVDETIPSFMNMPFFAHATEMNGFSSQINLEIEDAFNYIIGNYGVGLGPVSYFTNYYPTGYSENNFTLVEPIFGYGCITPEDMEEYDDWDDEDDGDEQPSEAQYNEYNNKPVALRAIHNNGNHCYLFGFPLSYMEVEEVKTMMETIFIELDMEVR